MSANSLSNVCRTCLSSETELKISLAAVKFSFAKENSEEFENPSIQECLKTIAGIDIPKNEIFWSKICLTCVKELEIAFKFRMKALKAEKKIHQIQGKRVPAESEPARKSRRSEKVSGLETVYMVDSDSIPNRVKDVLQISEPFQVSYAAQPVVKMEPLEDPNLIINQESPLMNFLSSQFNFLLAKNIEMEKKMNEQLEISKNNAKQVFSEIQKIKNAAAGSSSANLPQSSEKSSSRTTNTRGKRKKYEESDTSDEDWEPSKKVAAEATLKSEPDFEITEYSVEDPNDTPTIYGTNPKYFHKLLPLKQKEQFLEFEQNVSEFQSWRKCWTNMIMGFRSKKGVDKFISGIMRKLLEDSCAVNFTWTGYATGTRTGNETSTKIKSFKCIEILLDKVVKMFPGSYREQAENRIKCHFRDAKGRLKMRSRYKQILGNLEQEKSDQEDEDVLFVEYVVTNKFRGQEFSSEIFPLKDKETFMELEAQLKENDSWKLSLGEFFKEYLTYKADINVRNFVRENMKRVFSDSLAGKYTWTGYNKQDGYTNYQERVAEKEIVKILELVAFEVFNEATIDEVTEEMKRFLREAKSRANKSRQSSGRPDKVADSDEESKEDLEKEELIRKVMQNAIDRKKMFENHERPTGFPEWNRFPLSIKEDLLKFEEELKDNVEWQEFLKSVLKNNLQPKDKSSAESLIKISLKRVMHDLSIYKLHWSSKALNPEPKVRDFTSVRIVLDMATEMFSYVPTWDNEEVAKKHIKQATQRYKTNAKTINNKLQTSFVDDCQV